MSNGHLLVLLYFAAVVFLDAFSQPLWGVRQLMLVSQTTYKAFLIVFKVTALLVYLLLVIEKVSVWMLQFCFNMI